MSLGSGVLPVVRCPDPACAGAYWLGGEERCPECKRPYWQAELDGRGIGPHVFVPRPGAGRDECEVCGKIEDMPYHDVVDCDVCGEDSTCHRPGAGT